MGTTVDEVIAAHRAAGRSFEAAGLTSFVRAEGEGEPIVLLHGLPSSSFLYRKVIGELAASAPERVRSLTILNTVVAMDAVPFPMEIYARLAAQRGWAALPPPRSPRRSASP